MGKGSEPPWEGRRALACSTRVVCLGQNHFLIVRGGAGPEGVSFAGQELSALVRTTLIERELARLAERGW